MAGKKNNQPHIGIFGKRNKGKSSLINALTGQSTAIVSEIAGTTTDPVKKSIEIHGIGPVILIDTAGIDDTGTLGNLRVKKTQSVFKQIDLALVVIADNEFNEVEKNIIKTILEQDINYILVYNKVDLEEISIELVHRIQNEYKTSVIPFSAISPKNYINNLIIKIKENIPENSYKSNTLLGDLLSYGDTVLLITPIDVEAPEGRLILPQVQVIRDILDNDCVAIVLKEREVDSFLKKSGIQPKLVITDSQAFLKADASIPRNVPLTSFSIVLARQKGNFDAYIKGTQKIKDLKDGDKVLLLESCTHHVSCDDIGRVKIPRWISNFTGKSILYDTVAGLDNLPRPIEEYSLVIQCGGCMITQKQLQNRLREAIQKEIPVSNYGMAIAYVQGIFNRAVEPFTGKTSTVENLW